MNYFFRLSLVGSLLVLFTFVLLNGQDDRIKVMTYNVLNYPNANNASDNAVRATLFKEIVQEAGVDAIMIQELKSSAGADQLLNELNNNILGIVYARAPIYNQYTGLGNMLFYNTAKLGFISQADVPQVNLDFVGGFDNANPRPPTHYRLYVQDPLLATHSDTIYLDLISAHLKASDGGGSGNVIADRERRLNGCEDIVDYMATLPTARNVVVGGDFNFYDDEYISDTDNDGHFEPGYGALVNSTLNDVIGAWRGNSSASVGVFTQSTRTSTSDNILSETNGGATSGLDDRFDLIFMDNNVIGNTQNVQYVVGSYDEYGTPTNVNGSALDGTSPVKNQLHQMSDHYPVCVELDIYYPLGCTVYPTINAANTTCTAGAGSGQITVNASITNGNTLAYSLDGNTYQSSNVFSNLNNGTYTIYVRDNTTNCTSQQTGIVINCNTVCSISQINVTQNCTGNGAAYTLDISFDAINLGGTLVDVSIAGTTYGPYALSGSGPTYNLSIPASDFTGDASDLQTGVTVEVADPNITTASGVILINEVLINADGGGADTDNGTGEFIELFCAGPGPCDIGCYIVGDDDYAIIIPSGTVLQAGDFYVLHGDNISLGNGGPLPVGTQFFNWNDNTNSSNIESLSGSASVGSLTNGSEQVYIWDPTGTVVDGVIWGGGSNNLGQTYSINQVAACGGGSLSLTQSNNVGSASNSGGGDAQPIHLDSAGNWNTSSTNPTPGANNTSQYPTDNTPTGSQCLGMTTYNEQNCGPMVVASSVSLKVFLEGPYQTSVGQMHRILNAQNLLPSQHPYNVAPYNYTGGSSITTFPTQMVDWVLVEARTGTTNTTTIETKVGILLQNGNITDIDGSTPLSFDLTVGSNYYFVIRHRNHLDIMTVNSIAQASSINYDFTSSTTQAFGSNQQKNVGGTAVMFAADMTQDLVIQNTDFDAWKVQPAQLNVYKLEDANLDGTVQTTDFDLWQFNKAKLTPMELDY